MGKIEREIQRRFEADRQDRENAERARREAEERMEAPVSRRELLQAIENVRQSVTGNSLPHYELVKEMLQRLFEELQ